MKSKVVIMVITYIISCFLVGYFVNDIIHSREKEKAAEKAEKAAKAKADREFEYNQAIRDIRDEAEKICMKSRENLGIKNTIGVWLVYAVCDVVDDFAHDIYAGKVKFVFRKYFKCECVFYDLVNKKIISTTVWRK